MLTGLILAAGPASAQDRRDPQTGRIRLIYIGDAIMTKNPVHIYRSDPLFQATLVPACLDDLLAQGVKTEEIHRYMRLYMPKTFEQMRDSYDFILLSDVSLTNFRSEHVAWMERCVKDSGLGLAMIGGHESFGGYSAYPSWEGTPVGDALPVDSRQGQRSPPGVYFVVAKDPESELMKHLPWDRCPPFEAMNLVWLKDGANELARGVEPPGREFLLMADWIYGNGRTVAFTSDWTPNWGWNFWHWDYYLDFAANLAMYACGVPVPRDVALVHTIRTKFFNFASRKGLLLSLFAFVETFGANPAKLEDRMTQIGRAVRSAGDLWTNQDYEGCLSLLEQAEEAMTDLEKQAMRLKDAALIWVYIIEGLAVTGTSMLTGLILWSLMVRRRLYREVSATRTAPR